jgi:cyclopropane-fatty-acyl-phospholipid synthase
VTDFGVSNLVVSNFAASDLGLPELGLSELAVSDAWPRERRLEARRASAPTPIADLMRCRAIPATLRRAFGALLALRRGVLDIVLPDGRVARFEGAQDGPCASVVIGSYQCLRRLIGGDVGFAEGYLEEEWTSDDLVALLSVLALNQHLIDRFAANPLVRLAQMARHALNRNSRAGARRNIHAHYDLGNAFYGLWLDPSMTYSSALALADDAGACARPSGPMDSARAAADLEAGQMRKYAAIAEAAGLKPDDRVLEIGCGWGGFAEYAASRIGCHVTGLTISQEQCDFARARIARAGLTDRVTIALRDYRDERGHYDAIVSIEMIEAVGEAYWPVYFAALAGHLRPGGRVALQAITIRDDIFPRYRHEMDFIRRYIFPGGMLPTQTHLRALARDAGLTLAHDAGFGLDYARTCRLWRQRFEAAWPQIAALGFDARFRRMWRYYLAYCEAGFRVGSIDVRHVAFQKGGEAA